MEIELSYHQSSATAAREANGRGLPVTYAQLEEYGLQHRGIAPAIRELVALGFVEVMQRGCGGNSSFKKLNTYRLTYRHAVGHPGDGSHEWRLITDLQTAEALAEQARGTVTTVRTVTPKIKSRGPKWTHDQGPNWTPGPGAKLDPRSTVSPGAKMDPPLYISAPLPVTPEPLGEGMASPPPESAPPAGRGPVSRWSRDHGVIGLNYEGAWPGPKLEWSKPVVTELFDVRRCEACGDEMMSKAVRARFCSATCRQRGHRRQKSVDNDGQKRIAAE